MGSFFNKRKPRPQGLFSWLNDIIQLVIGVQAVDSGVLFVDELSSFNRRGLLAGVALETFATFFGLKKEGSVSIF
jgi:hypothetical protein